MGCFRSNILNLEVKPRNTKRLTFKGTASGLRQFLAAESLLKVVKNAFYFTSKACFVLKIFKFLS